MFCIVPIVIKERKMRAAVTPAASEKLRMVHGIARTTFSLRTAVGVGLRRGRLPLPRRPSSSSKEAKSREVWIRGPRSLRLDSRPAKPFFLVGVSSSTTGFLALRLSLFSAFALKSAKPECCV